jgi:hypothetical protein
MLFIILFAGLVALGAFQELIRRTRGARARTVGALVVSGMFALFIWGCFAYQRHEQEKEDAKWRAKRKEVQDSIARFAAKYNAVVDWQNNLRSQTRGATIYTAQLAPVLVRTDARPILFLASVRDVAEEGDRYILLLDGRVNVTSRFLLQLECNADQANLAMSRRRGEWADRLAVVATITSVNSAVIAVHDEDGGTEQKPVSEATGRCVDLMPIGPYFGDILEMFPGGSLNSPGN